MQSANHPDQRVAVICIRPKLADPVAFAFDDLYNAIGLNTGNFMFTQAIFRQLDGDVRQTDSIFDPDRINAEFDKVVIPAANWLSQDIDWSWFTALLERVEIPAITIGIGLQAETRDLSRVKVSDSAVALAKLLGSKAPFLSTRGDFTRDWLHSIGVRNAVTTGCPSLYMPLSPVDPTSAAQSLDPDAVVLQATRYKMSLAFSQGAGVNQTLFRLAGTLGLDMIYQSEPEEIDAILHGAASTQMNNSGAFLLPALYGLTDKAAFDFWLNRHGKVFFDLDLWAGFLRARAGVIGTRLHGTILALNSGRPGILIAHDSRTAELADFASIPSLAPGADLATADANALRGHLARADVAGYLAQRQRNARIYQEFLASNGIAIREGGILA